MSSESKTGDLAKVLHNYLERLDALRQAFPAVVMVMDMLRAASSATYRRSLEKYGKKTADSDGTETFQIPAKDNGKVRKAKRKLDSAGIARDLMPQAFLVQLVSEFDAFLGEMLRALHLAKPELLNASQRDLTFAELLRFSSIEEAREYVLEKEIESVLRTSHSEQFEYLEKKFSIPLRKDLESWKTFIEVTERRNLFVHCNGVVSSQYLSVCRNHNVKFDSVVSVGDQLKVSSAYLKLAERCLSELAVKLVHVLWRKLLPADRQAADSALVSVTYELIVEGRLDLAKELLVFANDVIKDYSSDEIRRIFAINYAQCLYHMGQNDLSREVLAKHDWSAASTRFRLCVAVLREEFNQAADHMKVIGKSGELSREDYLEWPVFRKFREQPAFTQAFEAVFGELPLVESKSRDSDQVIDPDSAQVLEDLLGEELFSKMTEDLKKMRKGKQESPIGPEALKASKSQTQH